MMRIIRYICSLYFMIAGFALHGQVMGLQLLEGDAKKELNIEYVQNFILVDVKFNNTLPLRFILDTGAEHTILFRKEISDILGMNYEKKISLIGSDLDKEVYAYISRNVPLKIENTTTIERDIIVLEEDFLHLEELTGEAIHGIIGSRILRGLVLELNYKKSKIILHNGAQFSPPDCDNCITQDIQIRKHKPYIKSKLITDVSDTIDVNLLVDTGAALPFLLFLKTHPSLQIPEFYVKGNLGRGLGGDLEGYLSKVRQLQLTNEFVFDNIITSFQDIDENLDPAVYLNRNGLIGNPILSRFHVWIDFVKSRITLKAQKNFKKEFKYDMSGMVIYAFGPELNNYYVKDVIRNSPAYKAGIREGDMIKRIGLWPANFYSLSNIIKKMKSRKGRKIKLTMERNGVKFKTSFRLEDFLSQRDVNN